MNPEKTIPRISVVTPSLNQGQFIQNCIDSVAAQNWPDLEHFVIDGGSGDETLAILERNRGQLTDYSTGRDSGVANAINKGLSRCSGDIVTWLNADDFYLPGAFEAVAEAWRKNPGAGFWFGNGVRADASGQTKSVFNEQTVCYHHCALIEGVDYILQPATFINPAVLKRTGLLDEKLRWAFDWDLWIRLAAEQLPEAINVLLAGSREWEGTLTAGGGFERVEELRQVAAKYSGKPVTHGVLCYWLHNLYSGINDQTSSLGGLSGDVTELWLKVQKDMAGLGVNEKGFPLFSSGTTSGIGVDLYPLMPGGVSGGIVPWLHGVLRALVRLYPYEEIVFFHRPEGRPFEIEGDNVRFVPLHPDAVSSYAAMTRYCQVAGIEVLIRAYPLEEHPDFPLYKQIFVIPDIQHEYFPEFFSRQALASRRRAFSYALSSGGAIATMTGHSRQSMLDNPWTQCRDVFLMPAALPEELDYDPGSSELPDAARAFDQYFYMPANLWPHKNHRRLFEAFRIALPDLPEKTGLILTGNPDGFQDLVRSFKDLPIIHLGYIPHALVAVLLRNAVAMPYFSLFEGFGMPVLEAFRQGTPVICSNTTSLPEVGGDAALFCDPTDVEAMAGLLCRIVHDKELRANLGANAPARLAAFDWATSAEALHAAVGRVRQAGRPGVPEPLVSIVMPTRNQGRFIRTAIDSVLDQDYPHIELIVRDGNSTDDTKSILESYGDRIRWISEPDDGQADAINKGLEEAGGEILAYLNSDDILLPGTVGIVVDYFGRHAQCDLVYGNADYIDETGEVTGRYDTADYSFDQLVEKCCICQPAAFWRRRITGRIGLFRDDLQTGMDFEYWLRMACAGAVIQHIPDRLAQSRLHDEAKTLAMRRLIFPEIFAISREHGGYVSLTFIQGFWCWRLYESWRGGAKFKRFFPRIYKLLALVHFQSQVRVLPPHLRSLALRHIFHMIQSRSPRAAMVLLRLWRASSGLRKRHG